jgi:hypothetical protein
VHDLLQDLSARRGVSRWSERWRQQLFGWVRTGERYHISAWTRPLEAAGVTQAVDFRWASVWWHQQQESRAAG